LCETARRRQGSLGRQARGAADGQHHGAEDHDGRGRSGKYDDGRRIPGAIGLGADSKDEDILNTVKSKDVLIVTYCANLKCPASKALAEKLRTLGYKHVLEYPLGIEGWVEGGNEVSTVAK
jgi:rhodanese-related sulfurtransferase